MFIYVFRSECVVISPAEFVSQIRREFRKVTWPTQTETVGMTVAVILMVLSAMIYFFAADSVIYFCLRKILGV
ncbi:MAG: preprotein translocase subunit SecE [Holosporaceae bacterium]|jgi:preprotein translocase SecE subunit|nr:preprotein translocase subunit SecE [Holosporaceae bacterium]